MDVQQESHSGADTVNLYTYNPLQNVLCCNAFSNWGTETDADFRYHDGNKDPRGFGNTGSYREHCRVKIVIN